ncbi:MAG: DegT/DnrJ/EryC1/StrS family aminotransferase [Chitinophagaceae bacterium]|nr:DegT/DnrJ/EryC1/StrS family aminotransferase [Chitinophagaceae bacterium]
MTIDFRSDTFTKPSKDMLDFMFHAPVGDDVFSEDPSVNELEKQAADLFGVEASIFCPSGTMTNQIAIQCHTHPGDEVICEKFSHVYIYEGGGIAKNAGCQVQAILGDRGRISAEQIKPCINPDDIHRPVSRLVSLENTCNRGGGSTYAWNELLAIKDLCVSNNMKLHLDGARLFNAMIARKETPKQYSQLFDSISICLSKGLGTPVGSLLLGDAAYIKKARRARKVMGGGMRQAGYLAAAGIYALSHNIERLQEDHHHASRLEEALKLKDFTGEFLPVETNILIFEVKGRFDPKSLYEVFKAKDILTMPISATQLRMVTHLDISASMIDQTIQVIQSL